jgi:hypothetical protein
MELEEKIVQYFKDSDMKKTGPTNHWHMDVFMDTLKESGEWPWKELAKERSLIDGYQMLPKNETKTRLLPVLESLEVATTQGAECCRQVIAKPPAHNMASMNNNKKSSKVSNKPNRQARRTKLKRHVFANITNTGTKEDVDDRSNNKMVDWRSILWTTDEE